MFYVPSPGNPAFQVCFIALLFHERSVIVPVFPNHKKFQDDFCFYEKKTKSKNSIQHLFCSEARLEAAGTPQKQQEGAGQATAPGTELNI